MGCFLIFYCQYKVVTDNERIKNGNQYWQNIKRYIIFSEEVFGCNIKSLDNFATIFDCYNYKIIRTNKIIFRERERECYKK